MTEGFTKLTKKHQHEMDLRRARELEKNKTPADSPQAKKRQKRFDPTRFQIGEMKRQLHENAEDYRHSLKQSADTRPKHRPIKGRGPRDAGIWTKRD
jgi:hypothetical protein